MLQSSEVIFGLITAASLGIVLVCGVMGRYWLHAAVIILIVFVTFTAGKLVNVFGFTASLATPVYAGIFLASDAIHKIYGKPDAKLAIWKGFFALICVTLLGQLVNSSPTLEGDVIGQSLAPILSFIPSLFFGSALAYVVAQNTDIFIFDRVDAWLKGKHLWISNNLSTIVSQLVDSIIVYAIAFSNAPNLLEIILVAWVMKITVAIADTPFLYAILGYARGQQPQPKAQVE